MGSQNTSTPADPIQEGPGGITKDSLAAESSAFSDQYTSGVSGESSTFNNTDTSGAKTLPPAASAKDRLPEEEHDNTTGISERKYPESAGETGFHGKHSDEGYEGGPSSDRTGTTGSGVYDTGLSSGGGSEGNSSGFTNADPAPTYASVNHHDSKPKGTNIKEGGFDSDAPNASFTSEIGTDQDPGRQGEYDQQRRSAGDAADSGLPKTQRGLDGDHPYQSLNSDETA